MGDISQGDPEGSEEVEKIYYPTLWGDRLEWTGHLIPACIERWGLYMEAYVVAPPRMNTGMEETAVKIAYLPTTVQDTIYVSVKNILPTFRQINCNHEGEVVSKSIGDLSLRPPKKRLNKKSFKMLEHYMPRETWSIYELMAMLGHEPDQAKVAASILAKTEITSVGEKRCIITGKKVTAYRIGKILKVTSTDTQEVLNEELPDLEAEYTDCTLCELGDIRLSRGANLVFGRGNPNATGMIIAESPWVQEERDKIPLHPDAPAGSVLYRVMKKVGLAQDEWYLTNSVICRPLLKPDKSASENKPKIEHLRACSTRLKRTLHSVSPKLVVLLGATAYQAWFGHLPPGGVGKNFGQVTVRNDKTHDPVNYIVFFTYHPSWVARQEGTPSQREAQLLYLTHWQEIARLYKELSI